ncbi:unnamed protein product [Dibothriocephalus latus]|uniref:Uncharacterized protein n=1 Tax=Dibothriocephalus latus TaxID=60516 RepID=A0A3P7MX73_DIBLA|nr:unnamed protein product [Dibothriocephalus latus]
MFDGTLLPDLITTHFSFEPSLLTYGCLELLSYYVLQFAEAYVGTFNLERSRLWLRSCEHYIGTRSVSDCVTLDAVRTVLGVLASLPHLGRASVQLSLRGRRSTLTSIDDSEEDLETNACYLDVDANSLVGLTKLTSGIIIKKSRVLLLWSALIFLVCMNKVS